jgi:hypothetical protein
MGLFFLISSTLTPEHLLNLLTILQQNGLLQVSEFSVTEFSVPEFVSF